MIRKIARPMLASVYIADGVDTLRNVQDHVESTDSVLKKVHALVPRQYAAFIPTDPAVAAKALGGTKIGAGSLLALGKAPRLSAGVLALTAIPTLAGRHAFWETSDSKEKSARRNAFLTNVALLGGLGITAMDTGGQPGLRWRASHAAQDAAKTVQGALPGKSETESVLDSAGEWLSERANQAQEAAKNASENVSSFVDDNKNDWKKQAESLLEQGKSAAEDVQKKAPKWAEKASEQTSNFLGQAEKEGRGWLKDAKKDTKKARKRVVKAADKAQSRAEDALDRADSKSGRALKKASKKADKLQDQADKKIKKAIKKIG